MTQTGHCPPAETIAALAEGKIDRKSLPALLEHVHGCETCMTALELANEEHAAAQPAPRRQTPWLAIAAALLGVAITALLLTRPWRSPIDRLVEAAPRSARVVEPRLSGGFPWAAYRGPLRVDGAQSDPARLRLSGAAAEAVERGNEERSAAAQHAAGVALVLIDDPMTAVARLRAAAELAPGDARTWSDLAAAEYAAALRLRRPSLYPEALGHADRALRIEPRLAEALFNRALTLERLGLPAEAREAWTRYLEVDGSSEWAAEARQHLAQLPASNAAVLFGADQPRLERAAIAGDAGVVEELVDRHRERARAFGEVEYLGRWADAAQGGRADEARRWLTVARAIGDALARLSGESLLRDAVRAIDRHGAALAEAHAVYRRGRIAYSRQTPTAAAPDLRRAAELFAVSSDPLAFMARFYAASARIDRQDLHGAGAELEALARELQRSPQYAAAAANVQWSLALCHRNAGDWPAALVSLDAAAGGFERLGETSNLAAIEGLRAATLDVLGRPDEAWAARVRGLAMESREQRDRLAGALALASTSLGRAGRHDAARALMELEERTLRASHSDGPLVHALTRKAQLAAMTGDDREARVAAGAAMDAALRLADPVLRAREIATAQLAAGAAELRGDPRKAAELLTGALAGLAAAQLHPRAAEAALLRARAAMAIGDPAAAARDLDAGLAALDRMRVPLAGGAAPGVYDTAAALVEEAVRLHLDRGDPAAAFAYVERSRAQLGATVVSARELQQRLAGTGTAVVETFVSGTEVVSFAIGERDLVAVRRTLPRDDDAARYDALIRPLEPVLRGARRLVIVPDPQLAGIPYAALTDGTRRMVERLPVAIAPSASALVRVPRRAPRSLAAMALAADGPAALPESESEVADVSRLYPAGAVVEASLASLKNARADVIHIAGHTGRNPAGDAALLFAAGERAAWNTIASMPLHARVVTLAACETLRDPAYPGRRALSLGAGFLAAGVDDVVGTLVPIADRDARALFREVHRRLAAGVEPSEAVRLAQWQDLTQGGTAWRALAVATHRIDD
ncbi:MAG TPA: CHAT domain-containing protein [Thermoanaerobaculia bacterium]